MRVPALELVDRTATHALAPQLRPLDHRVQGSALADALRLLLHTLEREHVLAHVLHDHLGRLHRG